MIGLVAPLERGILEFHRMYAWSHLRPPLLYRAQSLSASRDPHCPAGCSLVWGLWKRNRWDKSVILNWHCCCVCFIVFLFQLDFLWRTWCDAWRDEPRKKSICACVPVNNVKRVEVAQRHGHFCSVESSPGFRKWPLPLKVVEKLRTTRCVVTYTDFRNSAQ